MDNPKKIKSSYNRTRKKNSNQLFLWRKKIELRVSQGLPIEEFSAKAQKKRQRERMAIIQKLKKTREERVIQKAQHEEEMAFLARERAAAEFHDEGKGVQDLSPEPIEVAGSFSPQLLHDHDNEEAIDPKEDLSMLVNKRITVLEDRRNQAMASPTIPQDTVFGFPEEVNVAEPEQLYWWRDKYQPRKPMYFSHVRTGYEWNKYNQTHYNHDNPLTMTVRGYKFTIFYPDLVDESRAPSYVIEKDDDRPETRIIRFHAGPPYEDIAFRIVNKDWDYSPKKGFKCTFERGILHLYFNYKRYSYRR